MKALITKLKQLNARYDRLVAMRSDLPYGNGFPTPARSEIQRRIDRVCGEIMRTERKIINALLA